MSDTFDTYANLTATPLSSKEGLAPEAIESMVDSSSTPPASQTSSVPPSVPTTSVAGTGTISPTSIRPSAPSPQANPLPVAAPTTTTMTPLPIASSSSKGSLVPQLSLYTNFRHYLKDWYDFKQSSQKDQLRPYSYATFSAAADIKSPSYLKLIISGQRNLSLEMTKKFSKALQHAKSEKDEFKLLTLYGQATDPLERNRHLKGLSDYRVQQKIQSGEIKKEVWENVPSWITWTLYAMTDQKNVEYEKERLLELFRGRANSEDIMGALERLIASGELVQGENKAALKKGQRLGYALGDIPSSLIRKLQAEFICLGMESLFQDDVTEREFGAMTVALTEQEFEDLKFELRHLRKRLYKKFSVQREQSQGDRVYQLNIQLYPLTKKSP